MYKRLISFLLVFVFVFSFSFSVFAQSTNDSEVILEKGSILTYQDFAEMKVVIDNANKTMTADEVRRLIAKKINEKEKMINNGAITPSYTIWGMNLNAQELALVVLYPWEAISVYNDAQTALTRAQALYQSSTLYQGNGDAFRHAYWNALMVDDVGVILAEAFATAHEYETPDGIDKTMDLNNNVEGRNIGQYTTRDKYETSVKNYVSWGWLLRIVNNQLVPTDSSGRL